jgi:ribonuclease BN (tRNA processing enzyme)
VELGGNTTCVEVDLGGDQSILLDAGTGVIEYATMLMNRDPRRSSHSTRINYDFIISHFHWDHILGFPFFHPIHLAGAKVRLHSPFETGDLEAQVRALFDGTYSPLRDLDNVAAKISFHKIPEAGATIAGARVTACQTDHPERCYGLRIEHTGQVLAYVPDHEARSGQLNDQVLALAKDSHTLIHDAQYTAEEYEQYEGWGHSSIEAAIANAERCGTEQVLLTHHDPSHSDDFLRTYLERHRRHSKSGINPLVLLAREGEWMEVKVRD